MTSPVYSAFMVVYLKVFDDYTTGGAKLSLSITQLIEIRLRLEGNKVFFTPTRSITFTTELIEDVGDLDGLCLHESEEDVLVNSHPRGESQFFIQLSSVVRIISCAHDHTDTKSSLKGHSSQISASYSPLRFYSESFFVTGGGDFNLRFIDEKC